ncbi:fumarylacetoacetate hydrolase family protein [Shewanella sp. OMA3-2]|uniref:fumarylacetoacetate hydrolase family protein n=1 Tax=Shewanella sp. OMA3-2 TaxID=2908650 RepID=UPI001F1CB06C|nr:fumarylacetoacetate hydrolase family protein [Shewanella sp. OMA3-2]UJF21214.1 fumarylacetoacetate hydrolase family protein [Shewanella sp. OMA3-2]
MQQILIKQQGAVTPSKILCIGRNYVEHIHELGNDMPDDMVVFLKPNSAISTQLMSYHQEPIHYEAELCFLVENGRFGAVGLGLDLTKRQLQGQLKSKGLPWERAKAFTGSAILSDFVPISNDNQEWCFSLTINGQLAQLGHSQLMMYSAEKIFNELTSFITLEEGDVVMTGTPKGVGEVIAGSTFKLSLWQGIPYYSDEQLLEDITINIPLITQQWQAI